MNFLANPIATVSLACTIGQAPRACHYADPHNTPARQVYYLHSASTESRLDCAGKLAQISQLVGKGGKTQAASFSSSSLPFSEA